MLKVFACTTILMSATVFAHASCDGTALHEDMEHIAKEMKSMSSAIKSGDNQEAVQYVDSIIAAFKEAREETPYKFTEEKLEGSELEKEKMAFQGVVDDIINVFMELESALKANDPDKIKSLMGQIGKERKIGHSNYKSC